MARSEVSAPSPFMASRRETQEVGRVTSFNGLRWNLNENLALRRLAIASEMESKSVLNFFFAPRLKLCSRRPSAVARGWQPTGWPSPASCWMESAGSQQARASRSHRTGTRDGTGRDPIFLRFYFWQPIKCAGTLDWSHAHAACCDAFLF